MTTPVERPLVVYGHDYCAPALWLRAELERAAIPFEWREVTNSFPENQAALAALTGGNLSVPTVLFPDGSHLIEPRPPLVFERLGLDPPAGRLDRLIGWLTDRRPRKED